MWGSGFLPILKLCWVVPSPCLFGELNLAAENQLRLQYVETVEDAMIHLYSLPLSSGEQTASVDLGMGRASLIPSADFIAGSVGFKDPAGLLLPNTFPW